MARISTLEKKLAERTTEGVLYEEMSENRVQCYACAHRCHIRPGHQGICKVRFNDKGELRVPRDYVGAMQMDPIEKKPFFHVLPGSQTFSFGMLGCDYHCDYCQNWITSQALRDPVSESAGAFPRDATARDLVDMAVQCFCPTMISTYNEPLITSEWSVEIFKEARAKGLLTGYVSNGNATREALEFIRPWVDCYKVDLKCFNDKTYRRNMGGTLAPVLETIERLKAMGFWVEVVTLIVPGMNDDEKELKDTARFIASVSKEIPWHVTAFHPDYKMKDKHETGAEELNLGYHIGMAEGLHYVYSGNRPGEVGTTENTYCQFCGALLIERYGYKVLQNHLDPEGECPRCSKTIPGLWKVPSREPNSLVSVRMTPQTAEALLRVKEPEEAVLGET